MSKAGAADWFSLHMGNALVGNEAGAAGLEVAMGGLKLRCCSGFGCFVAITGADCGAQVSKLISPGGDEVMRVVQIKMNRVFCLCNGDELEIGFARDGMRSYLCVRGGIQVPPVMRSRSTDLRAALGGFKGRALRKGDRLGRVPYGGGGQQVGKGTGWLIGNGDRFQTCRVQIGFRLVSDQCHRVMLPCHDVGVGFAESMSPCHVRCTVMPDLRSVMSDLRSVNPDMHLS